MPENGNNNEQKLKDEGIIVVSELPVPYQRLVESLTKQEVQRLIAMKRRLDAAKDWNRDMGAADDPFTTFMIF
jgi:hypothetical protein